MTLNIEQVLRDRYRIDALLGGGGMGAVYRAWDLTHDRPVVVKENRLDTPEAQRQFEPEARLLANLKHPHLPRVSDHFFLPGQGQYLVMDYIEGEDLNQRLARGGPVPAGQAVEWMVQVLDALEYLHSREPAVIHRDVKPANVKITPEGKVWLVDFGLAKVYDPGKETTMGARGVTPGYAPVEQYGYGRTDVRTDVYSLGATLYALLTGQAPPEAPELVAGDARLVPLRELAPGVPEGVEEAVLRAMANAPRDRFQTAGEFRAALAATFPGWGTGAAGSLAGGAVAARGRVPTWAWPALGGALLVAILVVLGLLWPHRSSDEEDGALGTQTASSATIGMDAALGFVPTVAHTPATSAPQAATARILITPTPMSSGLQGAMPSDLVTPTPTPTAVVLTATSSPQVPGGLIAFFSSRRHRQEPDLGSLGKAEDIYVIAPDGSRERRLAQPEDSFVHRADLVWSPDGSQLWAFSSRAGALYLLDVMGQHQVRQLRGALLEHVLSADWSPDGTRVAVSCTDSTKPIPASSREEICILGADLDPSSLVRLTDNDDLDWWPTWSPDGSRIAISSGPSPMRIEVLDLTNPSASPVQITEGAYASELNWSPDGRWIAFVSGEYHPDTQYWSVRMVPEDGGEAPSLLSSSYNVPLWSPDGVWLAFDYTVIQDGKDEYAGIYVANADGTGARLVAEGGGHPTWSPDGTHLAFERDGNIWVMNADGSNQVQITFSGYDNSPVWSPPTASFALTATPTIMPGETPPPLALAAVPDIQWSAAAQIGPAGQGGVTQQLLLDSDDRVWAFWEEHVYYPGMPERAYEAIHYRVWEGNAWSELQDIPGSENMGEPSPVLLPDGSILVKAEPMEGSYGWFRWDGNQWSTVPEMSFERPYQETIAEVAADGRGSVHLFGHTVRTWDGTRWRETGLFYVLRSDATAVDAKGDLHALGDRYTFGQGIQHTTWDGRSWSIPDSVYALPREQNTQPGYPALAIGRDGVLHAVWIGSQLEYTGSGEVPAGPIWISYSRGDAGQWSEPETIFGPLTLSSSMWTPVADVSTDGLVVVVWGNGPLEEGEGVYALWGRRGEWMAPVLLSPDDGRVHQWSDVEIDATGRIHVLWSASGDGVYHVLGVRSDAAQWAP